MSGEVAALKLPQAVRAAIVDHAQRESPKECCGLLIGKGSSVSEAFAARNECKGDTRFRIHPADHFSAIRKARAAGLEVVGAYHSHPESAAVPSARDVAEASDAAPVMVIVSLMPPAPVVRAFVFGASGSKEVRIL